MESTAITFIINGKTYRIAAENSEAIRQIPKQDRQQLLDLLEAVKLQDRLAEAAISQALATTNKPATVRGNVPDYSAQVQQAKPERLGSGDVDDLMARLIMEERKNQKPPVKPQTIYKWLGGIAVVVFLLILIF